MFSLALPQQKIIFFSHETGSVHYSSARVRFISSSSSVLPQIAQKKRNGCVQFKVYIFCLIISVFS